MGMENMKKHGAFSWNELMTTDVNAAKAFYAKLFDWKLEDNNDDGVQYTLANAGDQQVAGIMAMPEEAQGMPSSWGGYVTVDDVDEQVNKAAKLGGKTLIEPRDIPNIGRFAVISDPQGAMLSMITYSN